MCIFFFFKQKTAYEVCISDWSSDVCSSDLCSGRRVLEKPEPRKTFTPPISALCATSASVNVSGSAQACPQRMASPLRIIPLKRSEEHTSELQSLMRISYAVFCLKKKKKQTHKNLMKQ